MTPKNVAIELLIEQVRAKDKAMIEMDFHQDDSCEYQQAKRAYGEASRKANVQIDELEAILTKEKNAEEMVLRTQLEQGSIDRAIELLTPLCGVINDQYAVDEICQLFDPEINMLLDEPLFVQCLINFFNNKKNNETKSIEIALRICKLIDNQ